MRSSTFVMRSSTFVMRSCSLWRFTLSRHREWNATWRVQCNIESAMQHSHDALTHQIDPNLIRVWNLEITEDFSRLEGAFFRLKGAERRSNLPVPRVADMHRDFWNVCREQTWMEGREDLQTTLMRLSFESRFDLSEWYLTHASKYSCSGYEICDDQNDICPHCLNENVGCLITPFPPN